MSSSVEGRAAHGGAAALVKPIRERAAQPHSAEHLDSLLRDCRSPLLMMLGVAKAAEPRPAASAARGGGPDRALDADADADADTGSATSSSRSRSRL